MASLPDQSADTTTPRTPAHTHHLHHALPAVTGTAPLFGPFAWELPALTGTLPEGPDRYKQFARLLLDGKVVRARQPSLPFRLVFLHH
jgi:hypothetical protein